jgi:hypothetical protein
MKKLEHFGIGNLFLLKPKTILLVSQTKSFYSRVLFFFLKFHSLLHFMYVCMYVNKKAKFLRIAEKLRQKYNDKIPVILNFKGSTYRFLVNEDLTGRQMWISLRMRFKVNTKEPMILYISQYKIRIDKNLTLAIQYLLYRNDDGFLHIDVLDKFYKCRQCIIL